MKPGQRHDADTREKISEGTRRGIAEARRGRRVRPADFMRLRKDGEVAESIRPLLEQAQAEALEVAESLGGVDCLSAQETACVQDFARLGVLVKSLFAVYVRGPDKATAPRFFQRTPDGFS